MKKKYKNWTENEMYLYWLELAWFFSAMTNEKHVRLKVCIYITPSFSSFSITNWEGLASPPSTLLSGYNLNNPSTSANCRIFGSFTGFAQQIKWGFRFLTWKRTFFFVIVPRPSMLSTQPPIQWVPSAVSSTVKHPGS